MDDVVYICRAGRNEELRYSLRSLRNFPHDRVWVVGGRPAWYAGRYVRVPPKPNKYEHGRANLQAIVRNGDISEGFVLFNDDFFVIRSIEELPVLHAGPLAELVDKVQSFAPEARYTKMLARTLEVLQGEGISDPLSYNLHVPMRMEKAHLREALKFEGSPRSLVGNLFDYGGDFADDVKVHLREGGPMPSYKWKRGRSPFLSTNDQTFREVWVGKLRDTFPEASLFEY